MPSSTPLRAFSRLCTLVDFNPHHCLVFIDLSGDGGAKGFILTYPQGCASCGPRYAQVEFICNDKAGRSNSTHPIQFDSNQTTEQKWFPAQLCVQWLCSGVGQFTYITEKDEDDGQGGKKYHYYFQWYSINLPTKMAHGNASSYIDPHFTLGKLLSLAQQGASLTRRVEMV